MEILAAVGGLAFLVCGLVMIFRPTEMTMISPGFGAGRIHYRGISGSSTGVHISKTESQVYGSLAVVMGSGIFYLALFTGRKR